MLIFGESNFESPSRARSFPSKIPTNSCYRGLKETKQAHFASLIEREGERSKYWKSILETSK